MEEQAKDSPRNKWLILYCAVRSYISAPLYLENFKFHHSKSANVYSRTQVTKVHAFSATLNKRYLPDCIPIYDLGHRTEISDVTVRRDPPSPNLHCPRSATDISDYPAHAIENIHHSHRQSTRQVLFLKWRGSYAELTNIYE